MNKVICDVCGTAYPETAEQCPICGCAKPVDAKIIADDTVGDVSGNDSYTYVKGGRFSTKNVKKRNKARQAGAAEAPVRAPKHDAPKREAPKYEVPKHEAPRKEAAPAPQMQSVPAEVPEYQAPKSNVPLIITAVVLLLAIVATVIFIAVRFFPNFFHKDKKPEVTVPATAVTQPVVTETTAPAEIPCVSITLNTNSVVLYNEGDSHLLIFELNPVNTTDAVTYSSSNEAVATVNSEGKITAVSSGEALITVTCGTVQAQVQVSCEFVPETTVPETTQPAKLSEEEFHFNREDFTMSYVGEEWDLFDGTFTRSMIVWSSDDESVATIKDGIVTAQGSGYTEVHAEFNGQILTCIVRVG